MKTAKRIGFTITEKGYRRITKGPNRHQYAHRVKARECMKESGLELTDDHEVHHLCDNKRCDRDFHLLITHGVLHDFFFKKKGTFYPKKKRRYR